MNYYYLAASLPAVSMDSAPSMSIEAFESTCSDHLLAVDMEALQALLRNEPSSHPFLQMWCQGETQLRNAVVLTRARRSNSEAAEFIREHEGFETSVEKTVADAFSAVTPLERERLLDRFRWNRADELAGTNDFSSAAVLAYCVKLMLAERWSTFSEKTGNETLNRMVASDPEGKDNKESSGTGSKKAA